MAAHFVCAVNKNSIFRMNAVAECLVCAGINTNLCAVENACSDNALSDFADKSKLTT